MSRADGCLPYWARKLYRSAPRRAIVRVEADRLPFGRKVDACAQLECGHTLIVRLPARLEFPGHTADDLPVTLPLDALSEARCRDRLPAQRCEECQIARYPELAVLTPSGGLVDEGHFRYCAAIAARIDAHEHGRRVPPI